jgi:hypothetical protein
LPRTLRSVVFVYALGFFAPIIANPSKVFCNETLL